ncbi:MAG: PilW family protein [Desulfuromonadaceae bacterium]|nr:PilW family protein [Desulfuromonadaceae bacterium]
MNNKRGFTLIELLVVMAISGVVLASIFKIFNSSQEAYVIQDEVAAMQQNARVAKMFIQRDLRMAGSGVMSMSDPNGEIILPLEFDNNSTAANPGTDRITIVYYADSGSGCGDPPPGENSCSDLPMLTLLGDMPPTAAVANIANFNVPQNDAWEQDCYCNGTKYTATQYYMPFVITSPDLSQSAILITTGVSQSSGKLQTGTNVGYAQIPSPSNEELYQFLGLVDGDGNVEEDALFNKTINTFPAGSSISFFNQKEAYRATYYIFDNDAGVPCLYRDSSNNKRELIVEHVEDLQATFGLDTNDDGNVDKWINDADLSDIEKMQVRLATVSILARTAHEHRGFSGNRPELEDHAAGPSDRFRRRLVTFTVKVRNFGLN